MIHLKKIGALTSKIYSFTARNWELKSFEFIDFFDSMGSNIRIDTKGSNILRILPSVNEYINEEWISDKIRYSFDGLKNQRLSNPLLIKKNKLITVSWFYLFIFFFFCNSITYLFINLKKYFFKLSNKLDIESFLYLKMFMNNIGINNITVNNNLLGFSSDLNYYKLFNTHLINLEHIDFILLNNINLRMELPLLNLKLRNYIIKEEIEVYSLGYTYNYSFEVKQISNNINVLQKIINGTHWLCAYLQKIENPLFLIKPIDLQNNIKFFNNIIKKFYIYNNFLNFNWNGFNIINSNFNFNILQELNFKNNKVNKEKENKGWLNLKKNYFYILGIDDLSISIKKNDFLIYQGHHADQLTQFAKFVLPTQIILEKSGFFLNFENRVQRREPVFFKLYNSTRTDLSIFKALLEFMYFKKNITISFNKNFFINFDYNVILFFKNNYKIKTFINNVIEKQFTYNFFLTDIITKSSKYMNIYNTFWKKSKINFL